MASPAAAVAAADRVAMLAAVLPHEGRVVAVLEHRVSEAAPQQPLHPCLVVGVACSWLVRPLPDKLPAGVVQRDLGW